MWLSAENFKVINSIAGSKPNSELPYRVHPNCLLDAKVVSVKGLTGRVVGLNQEALRQDRYDSIDIQWDTGQKSSGVFLIWLCDAATDVKILVNEDKYNANKIFY